MISRTSFVVTAVALSAVVALGGCGNSSKSSDATTTSGAPSTSTTAASASSSSPASTAAAGAKPADKLADGTYCIQFTSADAANFTITFNAWTFRKDSGDAAATKLSGIAYTLPVAKDATYNDVGDPQGSGANAYLKTVAQFGAGLAPTIRVTNNTVTTLYGDRGYRPDGAVEFHNCIVSGG